MTSPTASLFARLRAGRRPGRHDSWRFLPAAAALAILLGGGTGDQVAAAVRATSALAARSGGLPLAAVDQVLLARLDADAARAEDELRTAAGLPLRYALPETTWLTPALRGTWEQLDGARLLWRLRIAAPGAVSLGFGFSRFRLPAGARLLVHSADLERELPAYTTADQETHGELWTPALPADEAVLELVLPEAGLPELELVLTTIARGYLPLGGGERETASGSCNVDVTCPEGEPWLDQAAAVAMLAVGGSEICTGFLVNNTAQDGRPLILTSASCGISEDNAASVVAYWRYQNSTCRPPGSPESGGAGDGQKAIFSSGAIFRARVSATDAVLVELDDPVPAAAGAFLAGWDRRPLDLASAVTIHHPRTDEKRISFENDPTTTTSYLGTSSPGDGTQLRIDDWDLGTTEGGSGGAPLFGPNGLAAGHLHGGFAACANDEPDWYGRLSAAWDVGATPATRLRDWLDPLATGVTTLSGVAVAATRVPPSAPSGLTATALSPAAVGLSWSDNSDNESTFVLESRRMDTEFAEIARLPANSAAATVTGLAPSTTYAFRVRAENPWGQSGWTNEASASTYGTTEPCVRDTRTACLLGGRFEVRVTWATAESSGDASVMSFDGERAESDQSAFYTFFDAANFEMGVKMADACGFADKFWVFVSGLTNQAFTVVVRDTANGHIRTYANPLGNLPRTTGDTSALDCSLAGGSIETLVFTPLPGLGPTRATAGGRVTTAGPDIRVEPLALALGGVAPRTLHVELDWMESATHSHRPSPAVLEEITATFEAAGYEIVLEVGNAVPHVDVLEVAGVNLASSPAVQAIVDQHSAHRADPAWFYSLWIHNYRRAGSVTTSAGTADFPPGRWNIVSLGSFAGQVGTFSNQVGTFVHMLGHNLGQTHSGQDRIESHDNKPNYLSVMNSRYMLGGIGPTLLAAGLTDTAEGFDDFSYSHGLLPALDESALDERFGVGLARAVDWDCDGRIEAAVAHDLRAADWCAADGTSFLLLEDFDNWTDLAAYVPSGGEGAVPPSRRLSLESRRPLAASSAARDLDATAAIGLLSSPAPPGARARARAESGGSASPTCATREEFAPLEVRLDALRATGRLAADGPRSRVASLAAAATRAAAFFTILDDGDQPLTVTTLALDVPTPWIRWTPQAPFTIAPGGAQRVYVLANLGQAPAGLTRRRLLVSSNDPDESPYPGGVTLDVDGRGSTDPCVRDDETSCLLDGRFEVRIGWQTATATGSGRVMAFRGERAESDQSAFYWFFDPANFETGLKMVDACAAPFDRFWVFVSGLTNQGYSVTVRDTFTGRVRTYDNPLGVYPQTAGDTDAFPCP